MNEIGGKVRACLYIVSNDIREGRNSVLGYYIREDGELELHPNGPYYTAGTGIDNNTHGKLGPNDNDTPLVIDRNNRRLFAVNGHSDTIAVFDIRKDGSLCHVPGSPFDSYGVMPNSLSVQNDVLLVANRNEDYHRLDELRGKASASYVSFRIQEDGRLGLVSRMEVSGDHKPTQIHFSGSHANLAFANDFQVDADFDGDGERSFLAGNQTSVQGQLHSFRIGQNGELREIEAIQIPETSPGYSYLGMSDVPSLPLGIWSHPKERILYVGLVTRNELGVFEWCEHGNLKLTCSVKNSGQDICWLLSNGAGTRLYTVNNLPRQELNDMGSTITTYDISEGKSRAPLEIHRIEVPTSSDGWFRNNRCLMQPGSTAFQCALSPDERHFYVICQRINQTPENEKTEGNFIHGYTLDRDGCPATLLFSRELANDGVFYRSRPQGVATIALD